MPRNFIFIGRSGCGKGTQAELLIKHLEEEKKEEVFYLGSGHFFREFLERDNYTSDIARVISERGGLQPEFLSVWIWANAMIENLDEKKNLIMDGAPRKIKEVQLLDSAFDFYGRKDPIVIYVNVGREEAIKRLKLRGRSDDIEESDINERMDWFDSEVLPVIEYFKSNPKYKFLDINGERSVEDIFADILSQI
jgi:adenylate kinase